MEKITLSSHDRVLIFAPHPDDESLAAGGLIQHALAGGARVRVIFATSGDNNPWPQRVAEKRWHISTRERARWGAKRREEARAALATLGAEESSARFLSFPDQGITPLLMRGGESMLSTLEGELALWRPTLLVGPSRNDSHPDHSALHVFLSFALQASGLTNCRRWDYLVHPAKGGTTGQGFFIGLTDEQVERKARAILCHETQMLLSRKRFTRYAAAEEWYQATSHSSAPRHHPIMGAAIQDGALRLSVRRGRQVLPGHRLLLAATDGEDEPIRWSLPLSTRTRAVNLRDERTGGVLRVATVRVYAAHIDVAIPCASIEFRNSLFVKQTGPRVFYDRAGWREVREQTASDIPKLKDKAEDDLPAVKVRSH